MTDSNDRAEAAAQELLDMRVCRRVVPDLPAELRPRDLDEAYAIQRSLVAQLCVDDDEPIGYKVACTSEIAQAALEIDRPLFGRLLPHTTSESGSTLPSAGFTHRVIEAEFGFRVGADVLPADGGHTPTSVGAYVDAVVPAFEVVDYRYESWTLGALPIAADNAIHGWWVHGDSITEWRDLDVAASGVTVYRNGDVETTGSGAAVLGDPLAVLAWLADELPTYGLALRAGDLVTTGVTTAVFEADPGDHVVAEFEGVGSVEVRFD